MITINEDFKKLQSSYLFAKISEKVEEFTTANPNKEIIKLGIGDVTFPLPQACIEGFHEGVDEMSREESFKGYGPYEGYAFLRELISEHDFKSLGVTIEADEIFVSDGAKSDSANIQEIFGSEVTVAVPDPVYPVYVDSNVMAGRTETADKSGRYGKLVYLECNEDNNFIPSTEGVHADLIYLCYPNNPTGASATYEQLKQWVDYALNNDAILLYDAAYVAFIRDENIPKSIYEIPGAEKVAIEMRSYSKTAGFTGARCGYTVIPKACRIKDSQGEEYSLNALWMRRQSTKFNGVSYPVQKAAAAVYSPQGKKQIKELIDYYLDNAKIIRKAMSDAGYSCTGGDNSPYIWVKTEGDSWDFFDLLLEKAGVVITPGSGFGKCGAGYIRISAFNHRENVEKAVKRITETLK